MEMIVKLAAMVWISSFIENVAQPILDNKDCKLLPIFYTSRGRTAQKPA